MYYRVGGGSCGSFGHEAGSHNVMGLLAGFVLLLEVLEKPWNYLILDSKGA